MKFKAFETEYNWAKATVNTDVGVCVEVPFTVAGRSFTGTATFPFVEEETARAFIALRIEETVIPEPQE